MSNARDVSASTPPTDALLSNAAMAISTFPLSMNRRISFPAAVFAAAAGEGAGWPSPDSPFFFFSFFSFFSSRGSRRTSSSLKLETSSFLVRVERISRFEPPRSSRSEPLRDGGTYAAAGSLGSLGSFGALG